MRRTGRAHRAILLGALGAAGCTLAGAAGGCANHQSWDRHTNEHPARQGRAALVFESPEVALANQGTLAFERFEFSRNDKHINPAGSTPLIATRDWPQPPRPGERRIRFSDWQQR
ncbi:MAG: hypothetical protein ACKVZJ_01005 [Phycisphaerales bacterium]